MQNVRERVARPARRVHHHLHKPVHIAIGWTSVFVVAVLSLTLITQAFAESHSQYFPRQDDRQEYGQREGFQGWNSGSGPRENPCPPQGRDAGFGNGRNENGSRRNEQPRYENPAQQYPPPQPSAAPEPTIQATPPPPAPTEAVTPPPPSSGSTDTNTPPPSTGSVQGESTRYTGSQNPCPQDGDGQREAIDAQRFTMMKRGLTQFTREVERVKRQVSSLKKKGASESAELTAALAKLEEIAAAIKGAQTADDLDEITFSMGDAMRDVQEELQKLYRQSELKRYFVMADREMSKINKQYDAYARKVKSSKLDLGEALVELRKAIDAQAVLLAQIKEQATSDPDEAAERLHNEFFAEMDSIREPAKVLEFSLNLKRGVSQIDKELKEAERVIKNLERQKKNVSELKSLLAQSKELHATIKKLSAQKPLPMDEIIDTLEQLADLREQSSDILQELTGNTGFAKPTFRDNDSFDFHAPQGFNF